MQGYEARKQHTLLVYTLCLHVLIVVDAIGQSGCQIHRPFRNGILQGILSTSHIGEIHIATVGCTIGVNSCKSRTANVYVGSVKCNINAELGTGVEFYRVHYYYVSSMLST